jgi:ADP-ribose pyrophosphatase
MTAAKKSAKKATETTPDASEAVQAGAAPAVPAKAAKAAKAPVKAAHAKTDKPAKKLANKPKAGPEAKAKAAPAKKAAPKSGLKTAPKPGGEETATLLDSQVTYDGALFRVQRDHIVEPGGREGYRDIIKHNGSVVILAVDPAKRKKDPWIVIERQYRHAAGQFLWELPAGKLDAGETPLEGAKRELAEETGYSAKKWSPLVDYFASPGFLGESMKVFLAEGLVAGDAHPEEDEEIDFRLVKLSELLEMVDKGKIIDGKTLTTILLYARKLGLKRK